MSIPGEKFSLTLDDILAASSSSSSPSSTPFAHAGLSFISDITEHPTSSTPPLPPSLPRATPTGFPAHRKRIPKKGSGESRFKKQLDGYNSQGGVTTGEWIGGPRETKGGSVDPEEEERETISRENEARLRGMSEQEIEEERAEILRRLGPGLAEGLMKRARVKEEAERKAREEKKKEMRFHEEATRPVVEEAAEKLASRTSKPDPIPKPPQKAEEKKKEAAEFDPDNAAPPFEAALLPEQQMHFPKAPNPTATADELDPSDPEFFTQLHDKYFPDLPADPSALSWMQPLKHESYQPTDTTITASALRFDFKGNLLPPRTSRELPVFLGLHHHADAPGAAGYTIPELARLARSTFPSQRCIAMQLLGRVLYKLGTGVYGAEVGSGLWRCVREGRVIESLEEAATGRKGGGVSVKSYATEALWLWQKGGGLRPEKVKNAD